MNERFLFRGKRKDNGEWVYGGIFYQKSDEVKDKAVYIICGSLNDVGCAYEVIPETIGQCTGLKDKNGKLIFEGDIVKFINDAGKRFLYVAVWNTSLLSWEVQEISHYVKNDYYGFDELCEYGNTELIGNIHDNPELLEVER